MRRGGDAQTYQMVDFEPQGKTECCSSKEWRGRMEVSGVAWTTADIREGMVGDDETRRELRFTNTEVLWVVLKQDIEDLVAKAAREQGMAQILGAQGEANVAWRAISLMSALHVQHRSDDRRDFLCREDALISNRRCYC